MAIIYAQGRAEVVVPATESIAVYSKGEAKVYRELGYPNVPDTRALLGTVTDGQTVFGPYAAGATIIIEAGASIAEYAVGVSPTTEWIQQLKIQGTPGVLDATGALTAAMMTSGIVTSTTAAAVAGTVPTGTVMDAAVDFPINGAFYWSVIATGANAFTVTAAATHTLVGSGVVATATSGHFMTRKTAANTFVTYRLA